MTDLTVANTLIRKNENGLYCLNDLHKASGGENKNRIAYWLQTKQANECIIALNSKGGKPPFEQNQSLSVVKGSPENGGGTFACKELVYVYAMWISAEFFLHVIQTYDAVVTGQLKLSQSDAEMLRLTRINPNTLKAITGERSNNAVRENYKALIDAGLLEARTKVIYKRVYLPTTKGLDYVKTSHHDIVRFKPKYHDLIIEAVGEYREKLSGDNADLFLDDESKPKTPAYLGDAITQRILENGLEGIRK